MNLESIVQTNNDAVSFICEGKIKEAHASLLRSIISMRSLLCEEDERSEATPSSIQEDFSDSYTDANYLQSVIIASKSSNRTFQQQGLDSSAIEFFDRIFLIRKEHAKNQRLISATILYNMAVIMHFASQQGRLSQTDKIVQLYRMCNSTILDDDKAKSSDACLLSMAALNNSAHINSMDWRSNEANQALEDLVSEMTVFSRGTLIEESDLLVFQLNNFFYSNGQHFRFAPSA